MFKLIKKKRLERQEKLDIAQKASRDFFKETEWLIPEGKEKTLFKTAIKEGLWWLKEGIKKDDF